MAFAPQCRRLAAGRTPEEARHQHAPPCAPLHLQDQPHTTHAAIIAVLTASCMLQCWGLTPHSQPAAVLRQQQRLQATRWSPERGGVGRRRGRGLRSTGCKMNARPGVHLRHKHLRPHQAAPGGDNRAHVPPASASPAAPAQQPPGRGAHRPARHVGRWRGVGRWRRKAGDDDDGAVAPVAPPVPIAAVPSHNLGCRRHLAGWTSGRRVVVSLFDRASWCQAAVQSPQA